MCQDGGDNYATGASLKATFARDAIQLKRRFPKVPEDSETYFALRSHPNFFGCEEPETALVVWLPNSAPIDGSPGITNSSINRVHVSELHVLHIQITHFT
jgi:lysophospholipase